MKYKIEFCSYGGDVDFVQNGKLVIWWSVISLRYKINLNIIAPNSILITPIENILSLSRIINKINI